MVLSLKKSWIIWACAALFFFYQFILRVSPSVMAHELMHDFQVDACSLGIMTSLYLYAYALMQIPVGTLLDKFGPRKLLIFATALCSISIFLFTLAQSIQVASLCRFLIGLASAFGFLSCIKIGCLWFPSKKLSLIVGLTLFIGTLGAMSGSYPLSFFIDNFGWRTALWIIAAGGGFLTLLITFVIKDDPPQELKKYIKQRHISEDKRFSILEGFKIILQKRQTWLIATYGSLMYVALTGFADMWGVPYLTHVHAMEKQSASFTLSLFYFGIGIGTPLFGMLSNYFQQFKAMLIISALGTFILFSIIIFGPSVSMIIMALIFFLTGVFLGGQFMTYSIIIEINPLSISGMATGCQNMACLASGIVFQPLIGWILDFLWKGNCVKGFRVYSTETFQIALSPILICLGIAIFISCFIREAYPNEKTPQKV